MKKNSRTILIFLSIVFLFALFLDACQGAKTPVNETKLWPPIEPFQSGYLKVSEIHEIYYELSGNPEGKPVFFLHGGPGGSSSPYMRRFCDPDKFLMVLSDQRGAGKSKPYGEIKENTTQHLVEDIERLRNHLKLEKIILFGGSWGTTLGLAYAEAYPENVSGIVLRGVFMATKEEIDHFYHGGVGRYFPETYEKLLSVLPEPSRQPLPAYLFQLIQEGSQADKAKYSRAWAKYEGKISGLEIVWDGSMSTHGALSEPSLREGNGTERNGRERNARAESEFEEWYKLYPRHVGRGRALKAYTAARKKTDHATLMAGAKLAIGRYRDTETQFIPHPATWLSGEYWLDDQEAPSRTKEQIAEDAIYASIGDNT